MSDQPLNFEELVESFTTAIEAHDDVPAGVADDVAETVKEACTNNEEDLIWESDLTEFMGLLDGMLDGIYGNSGYDEQINQLDDLREKMDRQENDQ